LSEEWKESIIVPIYKKGDKQTVVITGAYHFVNYLQKYTQHPAVKINSLCGRDFWRSSMWISTQQVNG